MPKKMSPGECLDHADSLDMASTWWPRWESVDTMPKDGSPILAHLRYRSGDDGEVLIIRWHAPWGQWVLHHCLISLQGNANDGDNLDPVAWMPLPEP